MDIGPTEPESDRFPLLDEAGLQGLAGAFGQHVTPPLVVFLEGELGAGKTTFVRALIQGAGYPDRVKSPTYGLLEHYAVGRKAFLHLDLYRIADADEVDFLGIADLLNDQTVLLVEWPERSQGRLPPPDLVLRLTHANEFRHLQAKAHSNSGKVAMAHLSLALKKDSR